MKNRFTHRILPLFLVLTLILGLAVPVGAVNPKTGTETTQSLAFKPVEEEMSMATIAEPVDIDELTKEEPLYADTDMVRVSILLEQASTLDAGYSTLNISTNREAMTYRQKLKDAQAQVTARIESALAQKLDIRWNLTLAANLISADVPYGQMEVIAGVPGVKAVELEARFEPAVLKDIEAEPMLNSSAPMTGSDLAWAAGYTGAGTRIAVIDTGIDSDHQSFDADAYLYSLEQNAKAAGMDVDAYVESLNLLDAKEIESVMGLLNAEITPEQSYVNAKIPYAYNYIDTDYDITHDNDSQGSHGSHVQGIAAANTYIPEGNGYVRALDAVDVQGVAPDAQLITMKVFGKGGGAYASDYMAAIEDALVLGCDAVNLSLGSASPGFSTSTFEEVMDKLTKSDTVVAISAGNSGAWNDNSQTGVPYLYADDVSMNTGGSPGSYTNSLAVASADNNGKHGDYIQVGDTMIFYNQSAYSNAPIKTIAGDYDYIFIDGLGSLEDWAAVGSELEGKVAVCSRGSLSFSEKANNAVSCGAVAVIIYNNQSGTINMDLTDYTYTKPVISITQDDGAAMKREATEITDREGNPIYYVGKLTIAEKIGFEDTSTGYINMSSFSSWGVPGSLILKPEITAPGGNIYSINGVDPSGKAYENNSGTSMAAPQVAGMAALVAQYIRENDLEARTGMSNRQLTNSLLMSTATPEIEEASGYYWSVLKQGAGLAQVNNAVNAGAYIRMHEDATASWEDGKVKVELGDDPDRTGHYSFGFSVHNFSEEDKSYALRSDFFTQATFQYGEYTYLDTWTTPIAADVVYTVNGEIYRPTGTVLCDLDGDGDTDADDAQLILEYCIDNIDSVDPAADVSGDGVISTYDAHMILNNLETQAFTLAEGESAEVQVTLTFSEELKAWLDETYVNGAYIEGYVFCEPVATEDGDMGVTHSIPVMGFYGSWTDPSMFDKATYWDYQYGETIPNYTANPLAHTMYVALKGDSAAPIKEPNPYMLEDDFPGERLAISRTSSIALYQWNMIRSAAGIAVVNLDENRQVRNLITWGQQFTGAFYYPAAGAWQSTQSAMALFQKIGALGLKEGEMLNWTVVAIPEYYLPNAAATQEEIIDVINSGVLHDGAFLSFPMVIDDTAPSIVNVEKNLLTGDLIVTAQDRNYIAALQVMNTDGTKVYATALPEATEAGQVTTTVLPVGDAGIGETCIIALGDYAGNESFIEVEYGGEPESHAGEMYLFTSHTNRGSAGWAKVDPDTVYYTSATSHGGMTNVAGMELKLLAAEYVGGYVFAAADDGKFYVTKHGQWDSYEEIATYKGTSSSVYDMAYNPIDQRIYVTDALGSGQTKLYALNPYTGEYSFCANITLTHSAGGPPMYKAAKALTISPDGTFYTVNWGGGNNVFLYSFTHDDIADGKVGTLSPISKALGVITYGRPTMAWNETDGMIYLAGGQSSANSSNKLWRINPADGTISLTNTDTETYGSGAGMLYVEPVGLYILPEKEQSIQTTDTATSIVLNTEAITLFEHSTWTMSATVGPWNVADTAVTWTSSDDTVVTVDENGVITGMQAGTATVTATTNAKPGLTATCEVTVTELPEISFSALVTDNDGNSQWADFTTRDITAYTTFADSNFYMGGSLMGDQLYVQHNNSFVAVDADSLEITTDYGFLHTNWSWSDAAPNPVNADGYFGGLAGLCYNGCYFIVIAPETGNIEYWNLYDIFGDDPMALLAFKETGTIPDATGAECAANIYYMMTDSGNLWELALYTPDNGKTFAIGLGLVGATGIDLYNTSQFTGAYGTMIYDQETGCLVVSTSPEFGVTSLYVVDAATGVTASLGELSADVDSVTVMYQYAKATELELRINTTEANIYEGDTAQLQVKVRPAKYKGGVTWTSSDSSVATVDENGLVTAIAEGTAVITATSEDVNDSGEHVTATCTVNVEGLVPVNAVVSAQIETADGVYWADIDLNTLSTSILAPAGHKFTGAGYAAGMIWGNAGDFENGGYDYQVDPANNYEETMGKYKQTAQEMFYDVTGSPVATYTYNGATHEAFGYPVSISSKTFYIHSSIIDGNATGWTTNASHPGLAAIAFYDYELLNGSYYKNVPYYRFLALDVKGTLHAFDIMATPYSGPWAGAFNSEYDHTPAIVGNIGMKFASATDLSMTVVRDVEKGINGLVIADSSKGRTSVYFVDMDAEALKAVKIGDIGSVLDVAGLYSDFDKIEKIEDVPHPEKGMLESAGDSVSTSGSSTMGSGLMHEPAAFVVNGQSTDTPEVFTKSTESVTIADGEAEVTITAGGETNGILKITYDTTVLDFTGMTSPLANNAYRVNADAGIIYFDYATAWALTEGTALATLKFTFDTGCMNTNVKVATIQRNEANTVTGESETINLVYADGGHTWSVIDYLAPTCSTDGYETQLCTVCGETQTIILEANSDNCPCKRFTDLDNTQWYHEGIDFVLENGLMNGMSETQYAPNGTLTRAQVVTVLYRLAGEPGVDGLNNPFTDVAEDQWYTDAIVWAAGEGVVKGMTDTLFAPSEPITREQLVTIMFRYSGESAVEEDFLADYADAAKVSAYAVDAMNWAIANGIIEGVSETQLSPKTTSTR
ncbi:MAG: hypothetical protein E7459_07320, partial [Ruminococcaceae bacterium]|nr:hypothetical protein [Oscillospiraceae bacterium]